MTFSVNNRLILETYVDRGLTSKVNAGLITPGQRDGIAGLKVLMQATLSDGRVIPAGSIAHIREEYLVIHPWAKKEMVCDFLPTKFIIVDLLHIEFFTTPDDAA